MTLVTEANMVEAIHLAIEKCDCGAKWHHLLVGFFPNLTIGQMQQLVDGVKDWKVVNCELVIY